MATFLLLHGAFCRAWVWDDVAAALTSKGHRVEVVDLPSSGDGRLGGVEDDLAAVRERLGGLGGDTVVVAHSGAGAVLAELAGAPGVRRRVFVAALWPGPAQSLSDMLGGQVPDWMTALPEEGVVRVSEQAEVVHQAVAADVEAERFRVSVHPRYVATSLRTLTHPCSAEDAGRDVTYIVCEQDRAVPVAAQEAMASRADRTERLPSSHAPMLSMPDRLAEVLDREASR